MPLLFLLPFILLLFLTIPSFVQGYQRNLHYMKKITPMWQFKNVVRDLNDFMFDCFTLTCLFEKLF